LDSKLAAYNQRQIDLRNTKIVIVIIFVIYGIITGLFYYFFPYIGNILIGLGYIGVIITFLWYTIHIPVESFEIKICSNLSKALDLLRLSMKEKPKPAEHHRKKAASHVREALRKIERLTFRIEISEIIEKSMHSRLSVLKTNIQKFMLPKIILGEDLMRMELTLNVLADFFGGEWESLGIEHLDIINQNLESSGAPSKEIRPFKSTLKEFSKSRPATIGLSLIIGFGLTVAIAMGGCIWLSLNLVEWARSNLHIFILGGIGLSALVSQVLMRG
jgi:hypothetical protein